MRDYLSKIANILGIVASGGPQKTRMQQEGAARIAKGFAGDEKVGAAPQKGAVRVLLRGARCRREAEARKKGDLKSRVCDFRSLLFRGGLVYAENDALDKAGNDG